MLPPFISTLKRRAPRLRSRPPRSCVQQSGVRTGPVMGVA